MRASCRAATPYLVGNNLQNQHVATALEMFWPQDPSGSPGGQWAAPSRRNTGQCGPSHPSNEPPAPLALLALSSGLSKGG